MTMMQRRLTVLCLLLLSGLLAGMSTVAAKDVALFRSDSFACYRIPALASRGGRTLVAVAEQRFGGDAGKASVLKDGAVVKPAEPGRPASCSDTGSINLVVRVSHDAGMTWGPVRVLVNARQFLDKDQGVALAGNPGLVATDDGFVLLFTVNRTAGYDNGQKCVAYKPEDRESCGAKASNEIYSVRSDDNGDSWSAPTRIVADRLSENRIQRSGPGHGIRLPSGRLVMPGYTYFLLSDDNGVTWQTGARTPKTLRGSEATAVSLDGDRVLAVIRPIKDSYDGLQKSFQILALSNDGGATFETAIRTEALSAPPVQLSSLRFADGLIVSYPRSDALSDGRVDADERKDLTFSYSADLGATWQHQQIVPGPAAYSDLTRLDNGDIGLAVELPVDEIFTSGYTAGILFRTVACTLSDTGSFTCR